MDWNLKLNVFTLIRVTVQDQQSFKQMGSNTQCNLTAAWLLLLRFDHEVERALQAGTCDRCEGVKEAEVGQSIHATVDRSPKGVWETADSLGMTSSLCFFYAAAPGRFEMLERKMGPV